MRKRLRPFAETGDYQKSFAVLIERHPAVEELLSGPNPRQDAACVALAALLPTCRDTEWDEESFFLNSIEKIVGERNIDLAMIMSAVDESFAEFAPILKVQVPDKSLSDWLAESSASV